MSLAAVARVPTGDFYCLSASQWTSLTILTSSTGLMTTRASHERSLVILVILFETKSLYENFSFMLKTHFEVDDIFILFFEKDAISRYYEGTTKV